MFLTKQLRIQRPILFFATVISIYIPIHIVNLSLKHPEVNKQVNRRVLLSQVKHMRWNRNISMDSFERQRFSGSIITENKTERLPNTNQLQNFLDKVPPDPFNVGFIIENRNFCKESKGMKYLIYIHTSPKNNLKRDNVRQTWGNKYLFRDKRTNVVFVMGKTYNNAVNHAIINESLIYGDIIQGDFLDSYHNLSIKGVVALRWIHLYCKDIDFALKADDDAFVNIFNVLSIIKTEQIANRDNKLVVCPLWPNNSMPILRDPKKCLKWCIKDTEFPGRNRYPRYCAGISFAISRDMVQEAYEASFTTPFFWVDDVYISGLLFGKVKEVRYLSTGKHFRADPMFSFRHYANMSQPLNIYYTHVRKLNMFAWIWQLALERLSAEQLQDIQPRIYSTLPRVQKKLQQSTK